VQHKNKKRQKTYLMLSQRQRLNAAVPLRLQRSAAAIRQVILKKRPLKTAQEFVASILLVQKRANVKAKSLRKFRLRSLLFSEVSALRIKRELLTRNRLFRVRNVLLRTVLPKRQRRIKFLLAARLRKAVFLRYLTSRRLYLKRRVHVARLPRH
jgi:hypothetical protein